MDSFSREIEEEEERKVERTFGVRQHNGGDGGAPVGDADGEIARLELVHADHLPPRRRIGGAGGGGARAQQREEQRSSSHDYRTTQEESVSCGRAVRAQSRPAP